MLVTARYWWLLLVTACYCSFPLLGWTQCQRHQIFRLSNISLSMSELNKELIQSSLFIYLNRFFTKTLLPLWPKCSFFFPRKSSFILLLLINPIPFCMQKLFKGAFVSTMDFPIVLVFSNNNWRKRKICWRCICWHFFKRFSSHCSTIHIICQIVYSNMNEQIVRLIFNEVIKFLYNLISRATRKISYLYIMSSAQTFFRN